MKKYHNIVLPAILSVVLVFMAQSASGETVRYEARGKRDPFVPLVGIDRPAVIKLEDVLSVEDVRLEGIAVGAKGKRMAVLNGEFVKEGDRVGEVKLNKVEKKSITVLIGGKAYELFLPGEEGGKKIEQ